MRPLQLFSSLLKAKGPIFRQQVFNCFHHSDYRPCYYDCALCMRLLNVNEERLFWRLTYVFLRVWLDHCFAKASQSWDRWADAQNPSSLITSYLKNLPLAITIEFLSQPLVAVPGFCLLVVIQQTFDQVHSFWIKTWNTQLTSWNLLEWFQRYIFVYPILMDIYVLKALNTTTDTA